MQAELSDINESIDTLVASVTQKSEEWDKNGRRLVREHQASCEDDKMKMWNKIFD
jgi:hypothetical protein